MMRSAQQWVKSGRRLAAAAVVLTCFWLLFKPLPLTAQTDLSGFWVLRIPTGDGNYRETFLDLKQSGENVTGKIQIGRAHV